jgi:hypothetical protein
MTRSILTLVLLLAGCATPPPDRTAQGGDAAGRGTNLNPSGRPYVGPPGIRSSFPPGDVNTFNPLVCHPEGQGTVCARAPNG